jgi:DNA gyrase subunit A
MRIVIELKRGEVAEVVLNNCFKQHAAAGSRSDHHAGRSSPAGRRCLSLLEWSSTFIDSSRDVVAAHRFEQRKAEARAHSRRLRSRSITSTRCIKLIRIEEPPKQSWAWSTSFGLTEFQAQAISTCRLQRLTGLERDKILAELATLPELIARLKNSSPTSRCF